MEASSLFGKCSEEVGMRGNERRKASERFEHEQFAAGGQWRLSPAVGPVGDYVKQEHIVVLPMGKEAGVFIMN